jgi:hypothetical protein
MGPSDYISIAKKYRKSENQAPKYAKTTFLKKTGMQVYAVKDLFFDSETLHE